MQKIALALLMMICQTALALPERGGELSLPPIDQNVLDFLGVTDGFLTSGNALEKCDPMTAPSWVPETCPFAAYVRANIRAFDAREVVGGDARVIFFGETHISQGSKAVLLELLPELKARGFRVLALEMFNQSQQPVLDDYFAGRADLAAVSASLVAQWTYEPAGYLALIAAARKQGIRILALDARDVIPNSQFVDHLHRRDERMAERIAAELKADSDVKVFALTGALHAQCVLSMGGEVLTQVEMLERSLGIRARCLTVREEGRLSDPVSDIFYRDFPEAGAAFLPLDRKVAYSDGYIVLPGGYKGTAPLLRAGN